MAEDFPPGEVIIAHAPIDGSIDAFGDYFEEPDGSLGISGVLDGEWTTFYRLDGERLTPVSGDHEWIERLIPTGERDLPTLRKILREYATQQGFEWDGNDPAGLVSELKRRRFKDRWPRRPKWLDRWMHGRAPGRD